MPRSRGGNGGGGRRPAVAPQRPTISPPAQQQSRSASSAAHPPAQQQAPAQQGRQGSGLFGQMASTAAGVAVGSSIGHAIGGMWGGGSSAPAEAQPQDQAMQAQQYQGSQQQYGGACDADARNFTQCLDQNGGNMQICGWYLDQLKNCQRMASQY